MELYSFDKEAVLEDIRDRKAKRVLLQFPEGFKKEALELAMLIEKRLKVEVIVSGEPCWGACDVALNEAKDVNADLMVHFGHAPFIKKLDFPIIYVECYYEGDITKLLNKSLPKLSEFKKLGLVGSVQHIKQLDEAKKIYKKNNHKVIIPYKKGYAYYDGHVIGCEYNSLKIIEKDVDAFVVIGNRFHSLGAALSVNKPVFLIDVYNNEVSEMSELKKRVIKQRAIAIQKVKHANNIGIIIGMKPGQKFGSAKVIKEKLEKLEKNVIILTMTEVTRDKLMAFYNIDAFIELACPRIAVEDYSKFEKPVITFKEALVVLEELKWEDLLEHGFL